MKNTLAIFAGLTVFGAGVWYLFIRNQSFIRKNELDPVGHNHRDENGHSRLRQVLHKAKVNNTVQDHNGALIN